MTPAEIQAETDRLRAEMLKAIGIACALGVDEKRRAELGALRHSYKAARARMLEERRKTLRAGLAPPKRGLALRLLNIHLAYLDTALSQLEIVLSLEVAA